MTHWPFPLRAFSNPALQRRALSTALTALVHAGLLAIILTVPVYQMAPPRGQGGGTVDVRLYTVAGLNAQTDAPLNEPSLAARTNASEADSGPEADGADGTDGDGGDETQAAPAPQEAPAATPEPAEPVSADLPDTQQPAEPAAPGPEADPEAASDATLLTAPGSGNRALGPGERAARAAPSPSPATAADPGRPVATTQLRTDSRTASMDRPSFAAILARIDPGLDPDDFLVGTLTGDTNTVVRESLCLSSSQATLDAAGCPQGPNPDQAALAAYGLSEPGETPPQFFIDMDRLAFQLAQMGNDASVIERLMLGLSEARREAVRTPALTRQMDRDALGSTDNLGVGNPFGNDGIPMPDDPDG